MQMKMAKYNINVDLSWMEASEKIDEDFTKGLMDAKINQLSLVGRGRQTLDVDEILMMLINKDPINSMMAIEAKEKGDIDIERLTKTYFMIDHPEMINPESKTRSGSVQNRALDPLMLMLMMGDGPIDPMMMMLMMGDGNIDPLMLMLMMGNGNIDPMMMMLMMGGLGGND